MEWKLIKNAKDFDWYVAKLDVDGKYHHSHLGYPEKFPCKVFSKWGDDPNGPYYYEHKFIYLQEVTCKECGHKEYIWPNPLEDMIFT